MEETKEVITESSFKNNNQGFVKTRRTRRRIKAIVEIIEDVDDISEITRNENLTFLMDDEPRKG